MPDQTPEEAAEEMKGMMAMTLGGMMSIVREQLRPKVEEKLRYYVGEAKLQEAVDDVMEVVLPTPEDFKGMLGG